MKETKALSKQIATAAAEITRLEGEKGRCTTAINAEAEHADTVASLRQQRSDEIAKAFMDKRSANVASLDKEIATAEKILAAAAELADAARTGLAHIEQSCADLQTELASARAELTAVVLEEVNRRREDARSRFNQAVESLHAPLAEWRALDGITGTLRGVHIALPQSEQLSRALLDDGLRVVNETSIRAPGWLRTVHSEASEPYQSMVAEFRALGLDI